MAVDRAPAAPRSATHAVATQTSAPTRPTRTRRRLAVLAVAVLAVAGTMVAPSATVRADTADPLGAELMRLTNLDRSAFGKPALTVDPTLAAFAHDLSFACPTNPSLVLRGRAQDMADRGYFDHSIGGCLRADGTTASVLDVMADPLGYRTARAENIAWNTYGTEAATYAYGCAMDGSACAGTTQTSRTVESAERAFMQSSGHRATILGSFDRFGCGSALAADGHRIYACVFSLGGSTLSSVPSPTPDTVRPAIGSLAGVDPVRAGASRTVGATVSDNLALRRLEMRVDGRLLRTWTLGGTRATRSATIPAWRLPVGRHLVRWAVVDAAGNARSTSFWLYVR
jgi:uncharacterized protein YkwD